MDAKTDTYVDCAIRWAMEALDSTEYQTLCLKFVEDAYEISNDIELDGYSTANPPMRATHRKTWACLPEEHTSWTTAGGR
jgi:hypothetical protein